MTTSRHRYVPHNDADQRVLWCVDKKYAVYVTAGQENVHTFYVHGHQTVCDGEHLELFYERDVHHHEWQLLLLPEVYGMTGEYLVRAHCVAIDATTFCDRQDVYPTLHDAITRIERYTHEG